MGRQEVECEKKTTLSGGNNGNAKNLMACMGECDADSQCAAGLKCFQRQNNEPIPGCTGAGAGVDWDYCYDPATSEEARVRFARDAEDDVDVFEERDYVMEGLMREQA